MYSILLSKYEIGIKLISQQLNKIIKKEQRVVIIPWAFATEIDSYTLNNVFFKKGEHRYNKYVLPLLELGILEKNIIILDCYNKDTDFKKVINDSDILVIPGGNPEMLYSKVTQATEVLYEIKHYKGIIIGESAGTELQLKRYFITAKNNYYKYFAFYDGFGVLDDPFYLDVHSINNKRYLDKLQNIADTTKKEVYAIFDDGAIIYNRNNNTYETFGHVIEFLGEMKK